MALSCIFSVNFHLPGFKCSTLSLPCLYHMFCTNGTWNDVCWNDVCTVHSLLVEPGVKHSQHIPCWWNLECCVHSTFPASGTWNEALAAHSLLVEPGMIFVQYIPCQWSLQWYTSIMFSVNGIKGDVYIICSLPMKPGALYICLCARTFALTN